MSNLNGIESIEIAKKKFYLLCVILVSCGLLLGRLDLPTVNQLLQNINQINLIPDKEVQADIVEETPNNVENTQVALTGNVEEDFKNMVEIALEKIAWNGTKLENDKVISVIAVGLPPDTRETTNTVLVLNARIKGAYFTIYVVPNISNAKIRVVDDEQRLEIPLAYTMWLGMNGEISEITNPTLQQQIMSSEGVSFIGLISPKKVTDDPFPEGLREMMVKNPAWVVIPDYQLSEGTWDYDIKTGFWSHPVYYDAGTELKQTFDPASTLQ